MCKRIFTVLISLTATLVSMAAPSFAHAIQVQCGGVECANGAVFIGQSTNLKTQIQTGEKDENEVACSGGRFDGALFENQKETTKGTITKATLTGCTFKGINADIVTNVGTGAVAWTLQAQAPSGGKVTAHLDPASGSSLKFTVQEQVFGFSVATCVFSSPSLQMTGDEGGDTLVVEGKEQFILVESNSSECGTVNATKGDLSGSIQIESQEPLAQLQCGSKECSNGAPLTAQSGELVATFQAPKGTMKCSTNTFEGTLTENQAEMIDGKVTEDFLAGCTFNGVGADVKSNASTTSPWQLQGQLAVSGQITGHVTAPSGGSLSVAVQVQVFGITWAKCIYAAQEVKLMGSAQSDEFAIEGSEQFTLISATGGMPESCGTVNTTKGDVSATFQIETPFPGSAVVVHGP